MPIQMTATTEEEAIPRDGLDRMLGSAQNASEFLKAMSHETRLVILCLLLDGRKSVGELEQKLQLRQPFVSQQLARLRADELVEAQRDGKNVYYSIARPEVGEIISSLYRAFCKTSPSGWPEPAAVSGAAEGLAQFALGGVERLATFLR